jgi:hypothetical protein
MCNSGASLRVTIDRMLLHYRNRGLDAARPSRSNRSRQSLDHVQRARWADAGLVAIASPSGAHRLWHDDKHPGRPAKGAAGKAGDGQAARAPQVAGYVAVPTDVENGKGFVELWRGIFVVRAGSAGYQLGPVFSDVHGRTESGLYALVEYLRRHGAVAVLVPHHGHLTHGGCLAGADRRAAERFLCAPVIYVVDAGPEVGAG